MTKQHEHQAFDYLATQPGVRVTRVEPSYGRYNVPLFVPEGKSFWPTGGWATIQCWALALVILLEVLAIARGVMHHL